MKLLKLKVPNGYKMLEKGFEINFLTKTRVDKESLNNDLLFLDDGPAYPIETAIVGKNSSGKSTTLDLIAHVLNLLFFGRVDAAGFEPNETLDLEVIFFERGFIYCYKASLVREDTIGNRFLAIKAESLEKGKMYVHYRKDLSNAVFSKVPDFYPSEGGDNSFITRFFPNRTPFFYMTSHPDTNNDFGQLISDLYSVFPDALVTKLIHLFDDSIDYIRPRIDNGKQSGYLFKRAGKKEMSVESNFLSKHLSTGTQRGVSLYGLSMILFHTGGHFVIDEIEKNFHKNLIGNLILMYNDKTINKSGASIIYSTHYSELLDETERCDNINILHREGCSISIKNMALDYDVRTDLLRSAQFDENTFDNLLNYNLLMDLREELRSL